MSHPIPSRDYSEQHREESDREYAARARKGRGVGYRVNQENSLVGKLKKSIRESKKTRMNALMNKMQ